MAEIFIVEQRGVGKPDYTRGVSDSIQRSGLYLKYNQQAKLFARSFIQFDPAFPFIPDRGLAVGGEIHLLDSDTFTPLPMTIRKGFSMSIIAVGYTSSQDLHIQSFIDNIISNSFGINANGLSNYENKLWDLSTLWYDPAAANPHILDLKVYNDGGGVLYGGVALWCIIEAIGTPPWPTTKDCTCPPCGYKQTVSVEASLISCGGCGIPDMVPVLSSLKYKQRIIKC